MILVCGATGILGGIITNQLLSEGKHTRILLRHNSPSEELSLHGLATSSKALINAGAEPVYGDFKDLESLSNACNNVETIITTVNSAMRSGEDNVDSVDRSGNNNLIEVAKQACVNHLIFISFSGADVHHPVSLFQAKAETEALLVKSGLPYTILASNFFIESWTGMVIGMPLAAHQPVNLVGEGNHKHSFISVVDVSKFAIAAIERPEVLNKKFFLGGPEAVSWCEIVKIFSKEVGMKIPVNFLKPGDPISGLPDIVAPMLAIMETYDSVIPMDETSRTFGLNQTPIATVIKRMLKTVSV